MGKNRFFQPAHFLKLFGVILTILCFLYLSKSLYQQKDELIKLTQNSPALWFWTLSLAFAWTCFQSAIAFNWTFLLRATVNSQISYRPCLRIFLGTQIAKYLPLNIFHFAGRIGLARKHQWPITSVGLSILIELGMLCLLGINLGLPFLLGQRQNLIVTSLWGLGILIIGVISATGINFAISIYSKLSHKELPPFKVKRRMIKFIGVYFLLSIIALFSAWIAFAFVKKHYPEVDLPAFAFAALFMLAWIAGLMVPGAPGGIGVREAVFITLLPPDTNQSPYLAVILLFRVSTMLSDVFCFLLSKTIPGHPSSND